MPIPCWFITLFWVLAFVFSGFLGVFCRSVHGVKFSSRAMLLQQVWFNFTGSLAGWVALWCLVRRAWGVWCVASSSGQAKLSDFALGFVAFVGVSGYLPLATKNTVDALGEFVAEVRKRMTEGKSQ